MFSLLRINNMGSKLSPQFRDNPPGLTLQIRGGSAGIAGVGGIGSNVAASLVRAGIGRLVIVDYDSVELSNLNRQFYFQDQIGYPKVEALSHNLDLINPEAVIETGNRIIDENNACTLFQDCDVLVEAVDREETKVMLLEAWMKGLPGRQIFSCSGIAGYGGTDLLKVDRRENLTIVGDQESELSLGTLSSRVAIVANMIANEIIEFLCRSFNNR